MNTKNFSLSSIVQKYCYKFIYKHFKHNPELIESLVKKVISIGTLFSIKKTKKELFDIFRTNFYGFQVFKNAKSIGTNFWVSNFSNCTPNTIIGNFVNFNGMHMEGDGTVKIGNYFHSGTEVLIITRSHDYDNGAYIPYDPEHHIYKDIIIDDFVWIGSRVTILPGTRLGEGAIIQGGAVVHGEIPPCAIAGGNPAKVFKYRNVEHFELLKNQQKFY